MFMPQRPSGSKDVWLRGAYENLIAGSIESVKVMPLAKRLNLTRTGFYWHFKDVAELHEALIRRWEKKNTAHIIERCEAEADSICEALFNVMDCWFKAELFDSRFDLAIRNWAQVDSKLSKRLRKSDNARINAMTGMFCRFGYSKEQAEARSVTVMCTQIGYISMQVKEKLQDRLFRVAGYVELFAGVKPGARDVEKFAQRHSIRATKQRSKTLEP